MADKINAGTPMAEAEARAGIQPVDELLDERATLIDKVAPLRAMYGSFGTWDAMRKILLSQIKGRIRAEATRDKTARKLTNDQVDEEAHEDGEYIEFIADSTKDRATWIRLEAKVEAIDSKIMRGQAIVRFVSSEARL